METGSGFQSEVGPLALLSTGLARQAQPVRFQGPGGACPPPRGRGRERGQVPQVKTWVSSDAVTLCCGRHSEQQDVPAYRCWRLSHCPGDQEPLGRRAWHPLWPQNTRGSRSGPLRASLFRPTLLGPCPQAAHRPAGGEPGMGAPGRAERGRLAG